MKLTKSEAAKIPPNFKPVLVYTVHLHGGVYKVFKTKEEAREEVQAFYKWAKESRLKSYSVPSIETTVVWRYPYP